MFDQFELHVARSEINLSEEKNSFGITTNIGLHLQLRELILAVLIPLHEVAYALNLRPGRAPQREGLLHFFCLRKNNTTGRDCGSHEYVTAAVFGLGGNGNESFRDARRIFRHTTHLHDFYRWRQNCIVSQMH